MQKLHTISRWDIFRNRRQILRNPLPFHHRNFEKYGDSFRVKIGPPSGIIFTRDPDIIRHVLQKNHKAYQKSELQTVDLAKYIGHGLLTSNGDHWKVHRRMIQPAFHKKKLQGLLGIMNRAIDDELLRLQPNEAIDAFPFMSDLAFQVVAKSLFSRPDIRDRMKQLQQITEQNQKMLIREMRMPYLQWWFKLSGIIEKHLAKSREGRQILNTIVEERISSGSEKDDLLDMLLAARYEDGSPMSRRQLLDEVMILFTAGHETTANALSFTLFFLAKNPEIQDRVYKDVKDIDLVDPDFEELFTKLTFTRNCIEESLRLRPPAYVIDREAIEDDMYHSLPVPGGSLVLLSVYELHRHPSFWKDPEKYDPDRFRNLKPKEYANYYYPFGAGPRMCIGNNFAMFEMILTIAKILSVYRLSTKVDELEINPMISLKPAEVLVTLKCRNN